MMKTKPLLSLEQCRQLVTAGEFEAVRQNCQVSIAVVDDGGHVMIHIRMDGASPMCGLVAPSKARMAAHGRRETKILEDMVNKGRLGFLSDPSLAGMIEGGIPLMFEGHCIGAVGVSGARAEQDTLIATAAIGAFVP